jgi:hypothetical protein
MGVFAPEAGRKIRAKALKSLIWRKENEVGKPPFGSLDEDFWREKRVLPPKSALFVRKM